MQKIKFVLLLSLLIAIVFGELIRIPFGYGIEISPIDVITGLIFLTVILRYIKTRTNPSGLLFFPIVGFIGISGLSLLVNIFSLNQNEFFISFLYIVRWMFFASLFFYVAELPANIKKKLPFFMVLSGTILVLIGFIQYFYIDLASLSFLDWDIHWYRLFSTFFDPNFAGIFFVLCFFLSLTILIGKSFKKEKFLFSILLLCTLLLLTGVLLTFSRSALISLVGGFITYLLFLKKNKKIVLVFLGCFLAGILLILLNYQATEGTKLFRLTSSEARLTSISHALVIIKDHPILGIGFNAYRYAQHRYGFAYHANWQFSHSDAGTDNSFLFILATTGITGILAFFFLLFRIVQNIIANTSPFRTAALASIVSICISSLFINSLFYPMIMAWMWMVLGLIENT